MTLEINVVPGQVKITGVGGHTAFLNTGQTLLITDYVPGTFTIPALPVGGIVDGGTPFYLSGINPAASVVMGMMQVSKSSGYQGAGAIDGAWHNIGGDFIIYAEQLRLTPEHSTPVYQTYLNGYSELAAALSLRFAAESGYLKCYVEKYAPFDAANSGSSLKYNTPTTIKYFAMCGTFN